jgi:hydrogenase-4 component E
MQVIPNHPIVVAILSLALFVVLILSFVILGSHWVRNHVYAFTLQSWVIAAISVIVAAFGHYPLLYGIAVLTIVIRGLLIPFLVTRLLDRTGVGREQTPIVRPSSTLVIGGILVILALVIAEEVHHQLPQLSSVGILAFTVLLGVEFIAFLMLALRTEALSSLLGLLMIENGVLAGSLVLVPGLPFFLEIVFLFDLLVIIATYAVLARSLRSRLGATDIRIMRELTG